MPRSIGRKSKLAELADGFEEITLLNRATKSILRNMKIDNIVSGIIRGRVMCWDNAGIRLSIEETNEIKNRVEKYYREKYND